MIRSTGLIAIDVGNTNITVGAFRGEHLLKKLKIATRGYHAYDKYFRKVLKLFGRHAGVDIIISSVVPLALSRLLVSLNRIGSHRIHIVGRDIKAPIKNLYRVKGEVGQDRLVNAFAARFLYGAPCIIIDFGTAITFDIVSRKGEYLGALIGRRAIRLVCM